MERFARLGPGSLFLIPPVRAILRPLTEQQKGGSFNSHTVCPVMGRLSFILCKSKSNISQSYFFILSSPPSLPVPPAAKLVFLSLGMKMDCVFQNLTLKLHGDSALKTTVWSSADAVLGNFSCCSGRDKFSKVSKNKPHVSLSQATRYISQYLESNRDLFAPNDFGLTYQDANSLLCMALEITRSNLHVFSDLTSISFQAHN